MSDYRHGKIPSATRPSTCDIGTLTDGTVAIQEGRKLNWLMNDCSSAGKIEGDLGRSHSHRAVLSYRQSRFRLTFTLATRDTRGRRFDEETYRLFRL